MNRYDGEFQIPPGIRVPVSRRRFMILGAAVAVNPEAAARALVLPARFNQELPVDSKTQLERDYRVKLGILGQTPLGMQHNLCRDPNLTPCTDIPQEFGNDQLQVLRQSLDLVNPYMYSPIKTPDREIYLSIFLSNVSSVPRMARFEGRYEMYLKYTNLNPDYPLARIVPAHELVHVNDPIEFIPPTSLRPGEYRSPWYDKVYDAIGGRANWPDANLYLEAVKASQEIKEQYPLGIENYYDSMDKEEFYRKFFKERYSYGLGEKYPAEFVAVMAEQNIIFGDNLFPQVLGEVLPGPAVDKIHRLVRDDILKKDYPKPYYEAA